MFKLADRAVKRIKSELRSYKTWKFVKPVHDSTSNIKKGDFILLTMYRNEGVRIAPFLKYYRSLGVDHFILLDNGSTDGGAASEVERNADDVSVFLVDQGYKESKFGTYWMNAFLNKFAVGHWIINVDIDEFLVYPMQDTRTLKELAAFLDESKQKSLWTLMVDMYPRGNIEDITFNSDVYPFEQADYFDETGYFVASGGFRDTWIRGGPRLRKFFGDEPRKSPSLNKISMIKWKRNYRYALSQHRVHPRRLNRTHSPRPSVTGAILHFKFDSKFSEKVREEVLRGAHYAGGAEYRRYLKHFEKNTTLSFMCGCSRQYRNWRDLESCGLISLGLWGPS